MFGLCPAHFNFFTISRSVAIHRWRLATVEFMNRGSDDGPRLVLADTLGDLADCLSE